MKKNLRKSFEISGKIEKSQDNFYKTMQNKILEKFRQVPEKIKRIKFLQNGKKFQEKIKRFKNYSKM